MTSATVRAVLATLMMSTGLALPTAAAPTGSAVADSHVVEGSGLSSAAVIGDSSQSYRMNWAAGEVAVSEGQSASYRMSIGFWAGCSCPCAYDPQCDGVFSNAQDVVITVNVAFRGAAGVIDDGCPRERSDVNADGVTNAVDLVKVINVAFRGQSTSANYVDPCL